MIVVDASAAVSGLLNDGQARRTLGEEQIHVPHLIDSEVAGYVALAEALSCSLLTADARMSRAAGIRCVVTVVPR